jgi:LPS export ABC transporter protein LptC
MRFNAALRVYTLLTLASFLLVACENDIQKIEALGLEKRIPIESSQDVVIYYSDSAKVKIKVSAPQMDRYIGTDPYIEMLKGIDVLFYNDSTQVKSQLKADYAISYEDKNTMEARKNVVVVNEKGETLNTEKLIWEREAAKIYSDGFVKITTKTEIIYGDGFESNQDFSNYKIFKIKGTINLDENTQNP